MQISGAAAERRVYLCAGAEDWLFRIAGGRGIRKPMPRALFLHFTPLGAGMVAIFRPGIGPGVGQIIPRPEVSRLDQR